MDKTDLAKAASAELGLFDEMVLVMVKRGRREREVGQTVAKQSGRGRLVILGHR